MGVVKLWEIIAPVGRRMRHETLKGQVLAIDVSIWLISFLKAMRDEDGNPMPKAHLYGLFKRICKLLYFGVRPVFVFDGGTPLLKKRVLELRRKRRNIIEEKFDDATRRLISQKLLNYAMNGIINKEGEEEEEKNNRKEKAMEKEDGVSFILPEREKRKQMNYKDKGDIDVGNTDDKNDGGGENNDLLDEENSSSSSNNSSSSGEYVKAKTLEEVIKEIEREEKQQARENGESNMMSRKPFRTHGMAMSQAYIATEEEVGSNDEGVGGKLYEDSEEDDEEYVDEGIMEQYQNALAHSTIDAETLDALPAELRLEVLEDIKEVQFLKGKEEAKELRRKLRIEEEKKRKLEEEKYKNRPNIYKRPKLVGRTSKQKKRIHERAKRVK